MDSSDVPFGGVAGLTLNTGMIIAFLLYSLFHMYYYAGSIPSFLDWPALMAYRHYYISSFLIVSFTLACGVESGSTVYLPI